MLSDKIDGTDHTLADVFINHYSVVDGGNVNPRMDPHGELTNQNVLTILPEKDSLVSEEVLKEALAKAKNILYDKRQTRPRPSLDDKVNDDNYSFLTRIVELRILCHFPIVNLRLILDFNIFKWFDDLWILYSW